VDGVVALPRVLSVNVRNGSGCTVREVYVSTQGTGDSRRLVQSWNDPLKPGRARMFRSDEPPPQGWDKVEWRLSGAR